MKSKKRKPTRYKSIGLITNLSKGRFPIADKLRVQHSSPERIIEFFDLASRLVGFNKRLLFPNPFPNTYGGLKFTYTSKSTPNLSSELVWSLSLLNIFKNELSEFISKKETLETHILLGDVPSASKALSNLIDSVGYSYYTLQTELLLAQSMGGLEKNKQLTKSLRESGIDQYLNILLQLCSLKHEETVTASGFSKYAEAISPLKVDKPHYGHHCLYYKLEQNTISKDDNLSWVLNFDNNNSLVDLYESTLSILKILIVRNKPISSHVKKKLLKLAETIPDNRLINIHNAIHPESPIISDWHTSQVLPIIEEYTKDNHEYVLEKIITLIKQKPYFLDLYELLIKSIDCSGRTILNIDITPESSPVNTIFTNLRDIITKSSKTKSALERIHKYSKTLSHTALGEALNAFYCQHATSTSSSEPLKQLIISTTGSTPKFSRLIEPQYREKYLSNFSSLASATVFNFTTTNAVSTGTGNNRHALYNAEYLLETKNYDGAIQLFNSVYYDTNSTSFHKERATVGLIETYIRSDQIQKALTIVSETIVTNKYLISSLSLSPLFHAFREIDHNKAKTTLDWVVFVNHYTESLPLKSRDHSIIYGAYADFLDSIDAARPSQLIPTTLEGSTNERKLLYFLSYVCKPSTLEDDYKFENQDDVENERIRICTLTSQLSTDYRDRLSEEAINILRNIQIRKLVQKIDESKIYVDTESIFESLDPTFFEQYQRLRELWNLDRELRSEFVLKENTIEEKELIRENAEYEDGAYILFIDLFENLKENFLLHDSFGLDYFLSSRIRHGVFDAELRSVFEEHNLVTKNKDNKYLPNTFWSDHYEPNDLKDLDSLFSSLSTKVDASIKSVIEEHIQVSTKNFLILEDPSKLVDVISKLTSSKNAAFNYNFDDESTRTIFSESMQYDNPYDFCSYIFKSLWSKTNKCLSDVRDILANQLSNDLQSALREFENASSKIECSGKRLLENAISNCRSDLLKKITAISNWFRVTEEYLPEDYTTDSLVQACKTIYDGRNKGLFSKLEHKRNDTIILSGHTFISLIDAMLILLGNVVKHAHDQASKTIITTEEQHGKLSFTVSSPLPEDVDLDELQLKLDEIQTEFKTDALRTEGGTGYFKLLKTVRHDLKSPDSTVSFNLSESLFQSSITIPIEAISP